MISSFPAEIYFLKEEIVHSIDTLQKIFARKNEIVLQKLVQNFFFERNLSFEFQQYHVVGIGNILEG